MNWGTVKSLAIKAAPIVLGMVIGSGGTMAVQSKQTVASCPPVTVTCTPSVTIKEPKPINMLLKCPK